MLKDVNDPTQIARRGTDEERHEERRSRESQIATQMEMRRRAAADLRPGPVEIPRDVGFLVCDSGRFPDVPAVVSAAQHVLATVNLEKLKARAFKRFMMKLLDQKLVTLDSPFMRLALNPDVVAAASRYLGVLPILQFVGVYYSSETSEDLSKSQLYHCDSDDTEQVKVWVLCNEVTPETGPLTLLPAAQSDLVRKKVGYTYDMLLTDEQVSEVLGAQAAPRQFLGPPGTVGFFDTSRCLHFGSRFLDPTKTRLIVMLQYITPLSFILPTEYWEQARYRALGAAPGLNDLSRMILGTV
jgi:hypothetical protein